VYQRAWPTVSSPEARVVTARWRSDGAALAVLGIVVGLVTWNRLAFDSWLARFDIFTANLPWFSYLGDRLRHGEIPAWNPYQFSGTPFAADPQSGWMYLPAMLAFPVFSLLIAFKTMVAAQLTLAALATYGLARALGLGAWAAALAALAYVCGPVLQWNTYCCLVMGQFAAWAPLMLLGLELAFQASSWSRRAAAWCLAGLAISQLLAAWVGEGWIDALLLVAAYCLFRGLRPRAGRRPTILWRAREMVLHRAAGGFGGVGQGAGGILPRIAYNDESNLAGGNYARLGAAGANNPPWTPSELFTHLLGTGYVNRELALGGAVIVLALLAPVLAWRRAATPFLTLITAVSLVLPLRWTPLHFLFYLIPRFQDLHEHDPWRSVALGAIGPPLLAATAFDTLLTRRGARLIPLLLLPIAALAAGAAVLHATTFIGWGTPVAGGCVTVIVLGVVALDGIARRWAVTIGPALIFLAVLIEPTGLELAGSWFGLPAGRDWTSRWHPPPVVASTLASEISPTDPGGAGAFLQARLAAEGPFRYLGYGDISNPNDLVPKPNYMARRFDPGVHELLVNGRSIFLGLYDIQGYNPLELARYADFVTAVNGQPQNYHDAYLLPSGTSSRLLDLLDVRYVVVDAALPTGRSDVAALIAGRAEVFHDARVNVYERRPIPARAWIVHDVRAVGSGQALAMLARGEIDPRTTALVEGQAPATGDVAGTGAETATVTTYEPEAIGIATHAEAPGLLVLSEVTASGWQAKVDGVPAQILVTDGILRGVPIPAGDHRVTLRYRPKSLILGLAISATALLAVLIVLTLAGWRHFGKRHRSPQRPPPSSRFPRVALDQEGG
jgi:hypothetical protein